MAYIIREKFFIAYDIKYIHVTYSFNEKEKATAGYVGYDLVCFTTQVPDASDTSAIRVTRVRHVCYTNNMSAT